MPTATTSFLAPAEAGRVAALLHDLNFLAGAIPNVVKVEPLSETTAVWTVDIRLGPLKRKAIFRGELLTATPERFQFRAVSSEATIEGTIDLHPLGALQTEVSLSLTMSGMGPLRAVIDSYISRRIREDTDGFASTLRDRLTNSPANVSV